MDDVSQRVLSALLHHRRLFDLTVHEQTNTVTLLHTDTRRNIVREHERTRSILLKAIRPGIDTDRRTTSNAKTGPVGERSEPEIRQRAENHILRSLRVPSMSERYDKIAEAHATTFKWVFEEEPPAGQPGTDFAQWLKSGSGIYWINGKAGSGKSTLMRYVYDQQRTIDLLKHWSGDVPLTTASFFFWNSGTLDQKSQNGLLRCLIFELLCRNRDLIPILLPDQWHDEYVDPIDWQQDFQWNCDILRRAFDTLRSRNRIRICLFIDGLDEYQGDKTDSYDEIISFFIELVDSPIIKICLSSRPWLVFEDAFRPFPNLKLQDLTFNDITKYVNDKISGHERMRELQRMNLKGAHELTMEIVTKASGVFLWVQLAVKSLLDGFTNRDRISDLQRRLRELPADLESFHRHNLMHHVRPFYFEHSSQLFQIVGTAHTAILQYRFGSPPPQVSLITVALADDKESDSFVLSPPEGFLGFEDTISRAKEMADRLKSRCGGLLEVCGPGNMSVQYLHRTVRDFLDLQETQQLLISRTTSTFNPEERLLTAYLLRFKHAAESQPSPQVQPVIHIHFALLHARRAMEMTGQSYAFILDSLDKIAMEKWSSLPRHIQTPERDVLDLREGGVHWANFLEFRYPTEVATQNSQDSFLSLAVSFGLNKYVEAKLNQVRGTLSAKRGRPLLDYIVFSEYPVGSGMVSLLLRDGADPNENFRGISVWQYALELVELLLKPSTVTRGSATVDVRLNPDHKEWSDIFQLLVEGGADPNVLCMRIKNLGDHNEQPLYTVHFSTPSTIFSTSGLFPDATLIEAIKSRGGIEFLDTIQLQSTDWDDAEAEAMRLKPAAAQRLQMILRLQKQKKEPVKKNNHWRSRRKKLYRRHERAERRW